MNKSLFLLLLLICQITFAQTVVNNLHYKYTEGFKSPKKTDEKRNWYNFNLDSNVLVITTETPNKSFEMGVLDKSDDPFTEVIDRNINGVILIFGNKKHYILEQLAMFPATDKLTLNEDEEDQVINGYKCRCYKTPQAATPGNYTGMGGQIYNSLSEATQTKLWITTDMVMNDTFNTYILGVFRGLQANPKFKGTIMKMEKRMSYGDKTWTYTYELDTTKLYDKREKLTMPWNDPTPRIAMIEPPVIKSSGANISTCTGESCPQRHARMKEFLEKIAGAEKAKSTFWTTTLLPCNFWRTF